MIKTKVAFVEGRLLRSQSDQFKKYSKISDWLKKSHFCFNHVNRLYLFSYQIALICWIKASPPKKNTFVFNM